MSLRFLSQVLSTILTIVIGPLCLSSQELSVTRLDASKISPSQIDTAVAALMEAAHVTGVGIAILNDDNVVYLKTYGVRDKDKSLPLTPDSVMTAASLTKPAFAGMILQLVHERIIELDRPVYEYLSMPLPEYPAYKTWLTTSDTSKLPCECCWTTPAAFPTGASSQMTRSCGSTSRRDQDSPIPVRESLWRKLIVETVTKKSVNELMNEHVFQPLGIFRKEDLLDDFKSASTNSCHLNLDQ